MKKSKLAAILYYLVLIGGFLIFIAFVVIGSAYYEDEIQKLFDDYPYIIFPVLILYIAGYLYALKAVVSTKAFGEWEDESRKKAKKNKNKTRKRLKIAIPFLGIFAVIHLISSIYIAYNIRNGAEGNLFLEYWLKTSMLSLVALWLVIYLYKNIDK